MIRVICFDLDETLILDEPLSAAAWSNCAARIARRFPAATADFANRAREIAQQLWLESPVYPYCKRIGHSAAELLWAEYSQGGELAEVGRWAARFRSAVWQQLLKEQGIEDPEFVRELVDAWIETRSEFPWYPETEALLAELKPHYRLAIITNGVPDLQRRKLAASGLEPHFDAIAISGEVDIGKPDRGIFDFICTSLSVRPEECVMVGDNPERDIAGGNNVGMRTVFVERGYKPATPGINADLTVTDLRQMLPWLAALK